MGNCLVAQSGGPTVAINASLAGVISEASACGCFDKVYGAVHGIQGVLDGTLMDLTKQVREVPGFLEGLKMTPAMYLGSCRYRLPESYDVATDYEKIFLRFQEYEINTFFYIGGNDSMETVAKLSDYAKHLGSDIRIIRVPKTIDNDLCITDHTPGYGSAAKYVASAIREIAYDISIYPIHSVTIVEIMGRDAGWLAGASALARNQYSVVPHLIYLPEVPFDKEQFLQDVRERMAIHHNVVVAVSEGIKDVQGNYISATVATDDNFGHSQLSGTGKCLEYMIQQHLGVKVRSVEINILQRSAAHLSSATDLSEAFRLGIYAVQTAVAGKTGVMVTFVRTSDHPYRMAMGYTDAKNVAGLVKHVPEEWIHPCGNDITPDFLDYVTPLIQGESVVRYEQGLPEYVNITHLYPNQSKG